MVTILETKVWSTELQCKEITPVQRTNLHCLAELFAPLIPQDQVLWLATDQEEGWINCKAVLLQKHVLDEDRCIICNQGQETADHIISGCPFAKDFWRWIGWHAEDTAEVHNLWETTAPVEMLRAAFSSLILLCWKIWKHRHDVVFRALLPDHSRLIAACRESARLWRSRLPRNNASLYEFWCSNLPV